MWVLAWLQMGTQHVFCSALSEQGKYQLQLLRDQSSFRERIKISSEQTRKTEDKTTIICVHLTSVSLLDSYLEQLSTFTGTCTFVSVAPIATLQREVRGRLGTNFRWVTMRHTALGGLTNARIMIGWKGLAEAASLKQQRYPKRPLGRFLEPAIRLGEWRRSREGCTDCWYPDSEGATPYPWPTKGAPEWVDTTTVYFPYRIQRKLTIKEKCQLFDLRQDWSVLLEYIWRWDDGGAPPLRFYIEFIANMVTPLKAMVRVEEDERMEQEDAGSSNPDWGRVRAPWLGQQNDSDHEQHERINYFGWIWDAADLTDISVACKGDDAEVNLALWAVGGDAPEYVRMREIMRKLLWLKWIKRLIHEANAWLRENPGAENRIAVCDCVARCIHSDWWNWNQGSRLLFWRWPAAWFNEARDGAPGFHFKQPRPRLHFPTVPIQEQWIKDKDKEKLEKLICRGYIIPGMCRVAVPRFPVPKGNDDIRVVWDLAKNGVNETMYTPSFYLATMATYLRRIGVGFYGGDFDIGEQFHNYILHKSEQPNCGVEVPNDLQVKLQVDRFMRWGRLVFGWQSSPYLALRMLARALELAKGNPRERNNPFRWETVQLNLPGSDGYDPRFPRVRKLNENGEDAADLVSFYDDGRVFAPTEECAHAALRQVTSRLQYLGNQDAARKRRQILQRPGAWAGGIAYTDQNILRAFVSLEKWNKARVFLDWVWNQLQQPGGMIERKRFRSGKGFLVYMSTCYEFIQPYLKGFHLSEDAWREGRDQDGWKQRKIADTFVDEDTLEPLGDLEMDYDLPNNNQPTVEEPYTQNNPPQYIKPVARLREDVRVLRIFFSSPTPVQVLPRPVSGASFVAYGGGDASGEGFGGQILPNGMKPLLRRGFWCPANSGESSNWRELRNLIDTIREETISGRLVGREVWMATDNSTAANAYYRGTSSSRKLHEMITELRLLTIEGNFLLRMYHIAGTRMIASGIDGLSRGELDVAALNNTLQTLLPLHQSPLERSPTLRQWISSWIDANFKEATPDDWFYAAQQSDTTSSPQQTTTWLWDLAPAAALHALEELGTGRLKRHDVLRGVVLIPNLLAPEWMRRFTRIVDIHFTVPAGAIPEWPASMHESLTVGLYFPLFRYEPWDWKRVPFVVPFGISMSAMHKVSGMEARDILALPGEDFLVYRTKDDDGDELRAPGEEDDFLVARPGDHLVCPFECDYCAFYRLKGHVPNRDNERDSDLLIYIRRANIDAFWSRRPATIKGLSNLFEEQVMVGERFGFQMFKPLGPFGRKYDSGMRAAVGILVRSQKPGKHEETMKFSSVRKARALHTDMYNASAEAVENAMVWRAERARFVTTKAPTDSTWFNSFMNGYRARVGERRKQDVAISIELMIAIQQMLQSDWDQACVRQDKEEQRKVAEHGAYFLFLYCGSLRGFEGPKVKLSDLRRQVVAPGTPQAAIHGPHIGLPLSGRFKARSQHTQDILIPIAYETKSGLQPGIWAERLIQVLEENNIMTGWAFQDTFKEQRKMSHFEEYFYELLVRISAARSELFTDGIVIEEDYHIARSFRRGATTRATAAGVSGTDIDYINRWNIGMDSTGGPMRVLYADKTQLTSMFLRFSLAL